MDTVFHILLLVGTVTGLICIGLGILLVFRKFSGQTEIKIGHFGTLKTTESGVVLLFFGVFIFAFSTLGYAQTKKLGVVGSQVNTFKNMTASLVASFSGSKDFQRVVLGMPSDQKSSVILAAARMARKKYREKDFSSVETIARFLWEISPDSGHALYYKGEVERFRMKREESHPYFFWYLEKVAMLPENERGGGLEAEVCYQRAGGYCRQRTGWIHHLLANDFYKKGLEEINKNNKRDWFKRALKQVEGVWYNFPSGFIQYIPTADLERKLLNELVELGEQT